MNATRLDRYATKAVVSFALFIVMVLRIHAAISVGSGGSGTITFATAPAVGDWSTRSVPGVAGDITGTSAMDASVQTNAASGINTALASATSYAASGNAVWNSADQRLYTRPTGDAATLLMATLRNDTGSAQNLLSVSYDLGVSAPNTEQVPGHRVYWSLTGAANSWTPVGGFGTTDIGTNTVSFAVSVGTWTSGALLYLLWADDNGSATPDTIYTIDNVTFQSRVQASVELTLYRISDAAGTMNSANPGNEKSTFAPGEKVRVTLQATNANSSVPVKAVLNMFGPDHTSLVYDSHDPRLTSSGAVEDNSADSPLMSGEGYDYYSFDWQVPGNATAGSYDLGGAIHDGNDWEICWDTTLPGRTNGFSTGWILTNKFTVNVPTPPNIELVLGTITDASGTVKNHFVRSQTVRVTMRACNRGSVDVTANWVLNLAPPSYHNNPTCNSDPTPSTGNDMTIPSGGQWYSYTFVMTIPGNAPFGNYDLLAAVRSATDWETVLDDTQTGANTKTLGDPQAWTNNVFSVEPCFVVSTTADSGPYTLRQAIMDANDHAGLDTITFNIPGTGVQTITPADGPAWILNGVVIDGFTQPGSRSNTLANSDNAVLHIEINGTNNGACGMVIYGAANVTIRGLVINGCGQDGIWILRSSYVVIEGCRIGTDANGTTARPNGYRGVDVDTSEHCLIGGAGVGQRNIISGNYGENILLHTSANNNTIMGNFIGLDALGTHGLGAGSGIVIGGCSQVIVGGSAPGAKNIISGNTSSAIRVEGTGGGYQILGNYIGTDSTGTASLGNGGSGVSIADASNVGIGGVVPGEGNIIAFNAATSTDSCGVKVYSTVGTGIAFRGNSIYSNRNLGIDLNADGVTLNDACDLDTGPNNLQNFPVLLGALSDTSAGTLKIIGTLNSTANTAFAVDFYANPTCNATGYSDGKQYLGTVNVTTDGSCNSYFEASLTANVPVGYQITATATDPGNNTSEFSQCRQVTVAAYIDLTLLPTFGISDATGTKNSSSPGTAKSTFARGETVRVTLRADNTGGTVPVTTVLNIFGTSDHTTPVYNSDDARTTTSGLVEDNSADTPLNNTEGYDYYSFDWTIPANAALGSYDLGGAIHDGSNWEICYDTTLLGRSNGFGAGWILLNQFTVVPLPCTVSSASVQVLPGSVIQSNTVTANGTITGTGNGTITYVWAVSEPLGGTTLNHNVSGNLTTTMTGGTATIPAFTGFPTTNVGSYQAWVQITSPSVMNFYSAGYTVTEAPRADLVSVSGLPSTAYVGRPFTVTVAAQNLGGPADGGSAITASVLYNDGTDDLTVDNLTADWGAASQTLYGPTEGTVYRRDTGTVPPASRDWFIEATDDAWPRNAQHSISFRVTPSKAGTLWTRVRTTLHGGQDFWYNDWSVSGGTDDVDQQGWEVKRLAVTITPPPDLRGFKCIGPSSARWGQTITVQCQVTNQGAGASGGGFTQKFFLSANSTWGDADDVLLGNYSHPALGGSSAGSVFNVALTLPSAPPTTAYGAAGAFRISMQTDADNQVPNETSENNNGPGSFAEGVDWDAIFIDASTWTFSDHHTLISADKVFASTSLRGMHQTVAILDDGIDYTLPELGGGIGPQFRVVAGTNFVDNNDNLMSVGGHGTSCALVIGSTDANPPGIAPGVHFVALRVAVHDSIDCETFWNRLTNALQWVHDHRNDTVFADWPITTVNISQSCTPPFGSGADQVTAKIQQLVNDGICVFASAGNKYYVNACEGLAFPASANGVISVGACWASSKWSGAEWDGDEDGQIDAKDYYPLENQLCSFSQRSSDLDLVAPGAKLFLGFHAPDSVLGFSGTSAASPVAAGCGVIVREALQQVGRSSEATSDGIRTLLRSSAWWTYDTSTQNSADDGFYPEDPDDHDNVRNTWRPYARVDLWNTVNAIMPAPANAAPVLDNSGAMSLTAIDEDDLANRGTSILDLIASAGGDRITDANGDREGIAIVVANTVNGSWQFTTDAGMTWTALGTVSSASARLLAANADTKLRFQPNLKWNGTISSAITFRAWDQTSGSNGGTADVSSNGGATAFSTATETASITVNPVNDPPVASDITRDGYEDQLIAVTMPATDVDSSSLTYVITSGPSHGTLDPGDGELRVYHPNSDWNGTDSFTFVADDGHLSSQEATVTINVAAVNDPPSFTMSRSLIEVQRGAGQQTIPNWAPFSPGPANESGQTVLNYTVRSVSNPGIFSASPSVSQNGTLTFTPAVNAVGHSTFEALVRDNGGTANGGVDTSSPQTCTIVVNGIYPDDAAQFVETRRVAQGWELRIQGRPGARYDILTSPNLQSWTTWTNLTCTGGSAQAVETTVGQSTRFFKAVLVP